MKLVRFILLTSGLFSQFAQAQPSVVTFDCHVMLENKTHHIQSAVATGAADARRMVVESGVEARRGVRLAIKEVRECVPRNSGSFSDPVMESRRKSREL